MLLTISTTHRQATDLSFSNQPNHVGVLCTHGDACLTIERTLLDLFQLAFDPVNGKVAIIYTSDTLATTDICYGGQPNAGLPDCPGTRCPSSCSRSSFKPFVALSHGRRGHRVRGGRCCTSPGRNPPPGLFRIGRAPIRSLSVDCHWRRKRAALSCTSPASSRLGAMAVMPQEPCHHNADDCQGDLHEEMLHEFFHPTLPSST
jgi:hypothetical protein